MPLDPQAQNFLSRLAAAHLPSIQDQTIEQARADGSLNPVLGNAAARRAGRESDDRRPGRRPRDPIDHAGRGEARAGAVADRRLLPRRRMGPRGHRLSRERLPALANASNAMVAIVDYRLAPEHRFPAAADDAYAALVWISAHATEIGGDPSRIAVCGDSAGGNLAAVATLKVRDCGGPAIAFQALAYPITDYRPDAGSYVEFAEGFFLSRAEMLWYWDQYAPNLEDRTLPLASPNRAEDLSNLPPALVVTAEYDVLRDEGEAYARRLAEAGVQVELSRYDGMIHGFLRRYPFFDQGRAAIEEIGAAFRALFEVKALRRDAGEAE